MIKLARMERVNKKKGIIYPEDKMKNSWDIWITVVLLITCIILPLRIAFTKPQENDFTAHVWLTVNSLFDLSFLIDMVIIFNSAYYDYDVLIVDDRAQIAKRYLTGWFAIDLVSIIPFDILFSELSLNGLIRFAKIGKLNKLIKITRLIKLFKILKEQKRIFKLLTEHLKLGIGFERLVFFFIMSFLAIHIVTCLWIIFG